MNRFQFPTVWFKTCLRSKVYCDWSGADRYLKFALPKNLLKYKSITLTPKHWWNSRLYVFINEYSNRKKQLVEYVFDWEINWFILNFIFRNRRRISVVRYDYQNVKPYPRLLWHIDEHIYVLFCQQINSGLVFLSFSSGFCP